MAVPQTVMTIGIERQSNQPQNLFLFVPKLFILTTSEPTNQLDEQYYGRNSRQYRKPVWKIGSD